MLRNKEEEVFLLSVSLFLLLRTAAANDREWDFFPALYRRPMLRGGPESEKGPIGSVAI